MSHRCYRSRRYCQGFTLTEAILVAAILAIIAAVAYLAAAPSRQSSLRIVTASRMKQIYAAMILYGEMYDVYEEVPGLGNVPLLPIENPRQLTAHGLTIDQLYSAVCPQGLVRDKFLTSFVTQPPARQGEDGDLLRVEFREKVASEQGSYTLLFDETHDHTDFWPHESSTDLLMQRKHHIELKVNGTVKSVRRPGIRGSSPFFL